MPSLALGIEDEGEPGIGEAWAIVLVTAVLIYALVYGLARLF